MSLNMWVRTLSGQAPKASKPPRSLNKLASELSAKYPGCLGCSPSTTAAMTLKPLAAALAWPIEMAGSGASGEAAVRPLTKPQPVILVDRTPLG